MTSLIALIPGLDGMLASEASLLTDEMIGAAAFIGGIVNPGDQGAVLLHSSM